MVATTYIKAAHTALTSRALTFADSLEYHRDRTRFLASHPSYADAALSALRKREFSRLRTSVYLDSVGAALYPSSLVRSQSRWLLRSVAGNPHSDSPASLLSSRAMDDARRAVLQFFDADEAVYDVVWTSNASGGLRVVGESYDWRGRKVVLPRDAHNSVNGIARLAQAGGGTFEIVEFDTSSSSGAQKDTISRAAYLSHLTKPGPKGIALFTGQSNISGAKLDLSLLPLAHSLGWHVALDAAALAPTTRISLRALRNSVDFMVVSLYKICGLPTGVGALVMRKERYEDMTMKRTFFGGNIKGITMDAFEFTLVDGVGRFEDGTPNFASMAGVREGLEFAGRWMERAGRRNRALMLWLVRELEGIYYPAADEEGESVGEKRSSSFSSSSACCASSTPATITANRVRVVHIGGSPTDPRTTLPLVFTAPTGTALNYRFVIFAAASLNISLRGGPCMCNPGASSSVLQRGHITDLAASTLLADADVGVVRVSLGVVSNFMDVWRFVRFVRLLTVEEWRTEMWHRFERMYPGREMGCDVAELQERATRKR